MHFIVPDPTLYKTDHSAVKIRIILIGLSGVCAQQSGYYTSHYFLSSFLSSLKRSAKSPNLRISVSADGGPRARVCAR
jgi:hypothetical protein